MSNNTVYTASATYNEKAITSFSRVQFSAFKTRKAFLILAISAGLILLGMSGAIGGAGVVPAVTGCLMITYPVFIPKNNAETIIKSCNGKFAKSKYHFDDSGFDIFSGKDTNRIYFDNIIRLSEDGEYLLLFGAPMVAYIVEKKTLKPGSVENFKRFVSKRVGLEWIEYRPWYKLKISALIKAKKNTKKIPKQP